MFKAHYYKSDGKKGRARKLPDVLFDGVVNEGVLHQVVKAYLSNQRQGTASAKNRSAVRGGSRKPWRQKGTGRARQGTIRAAQWAGGGRAFPPIPHSWRQRVPRKVKALARRSAFNFRAAEDRVVLVDGFDLETPKTREIREYLKAIELDGAKVLILTAGIKEMVYLSCRNLSNVKVLPFGEESPYDILYADVVVIERAAVDELGAGDAEDGEDDDAPDAEAPVQEKAAVKKKPAAKKKAAAEDEEKPAAKKKAAAKKKPAAKKKAEDEDEEKPAAKKKAAAKKKPAAKKKAAAEKDADEAAEAASDEEEKSDG